ncbi:FAD-binding protein [Teredinibacter turnerae]
MEHHILSGKGVQSRFGEHLWLDIRLLGKKHIEGKLREVKEICEYFLGVDPIKDLIPVRPCQHYSMGGVRTNYKGESPQLRGLFAAGEAACWDMHGFNRLGGNSVAETAVAGMIVGEFMADYVGTEGADITVSTALIRDAYNMQASRLAGYCNSKGNENPFHIMRSMQELMSSNVAIFRHGDKLQEAVSQLQALRERAKNIAVHSSARGGSPELVAAYRVESMLRLSLCVAQGALAREESRGAHFREDFKLRNDKDWLCRTLASWNMSEDFMPTLNYEPLDVMKMEMPPGWRGYGAKDRVDHPDTPVRQAEVDSIKAKYENGNRFDCQDELMAYRAKLPEALQGKNARLGEDDNGRLVEAGN